MIILNLTAEAALGWSHASQPLVRAMGRFEQEGGGSGRYPASMRTAPLASCGGPPAQSLSQSMLKITLLYKTTIIFHDIIKHTSYPLTSHMEVQCTEGNTHTHHLDYKWQIDLTLNPVTPTSPDKIWQHTM
jgi:hypothetical protein